MSGIQLPMDSINRPRQRLATGAVAPEDTPAVLEQSTATGADVVAIETAEWSPAMPEAPDVRASFAYDQSLRQIIITLQREDTGEVVQQIPSDAMIRFIHEVMHLAGTQFDEKG